MTPRSLESYGARSVLVSVLLLVSFAPIVSIGSDTSSAYEPHDPIYIVGDSELTSDNGVTQGSGTVDDPYVIEDWDASLTIFNTTSHLVIRNMRIVGERVNIWWAGGLWLSNVTNCTIERCWKAPAPVEDFTWFRMEFCSNITVRMCRIDQEVSVSNSAHAALQSNVVCSNGIVIKSSSDIDLRDNTIIDPAALHDPGLGIFVNGSDDVRIHDNYLLRKSAHLLPSRGISLESSTNVVVQGNYILSFHVQAWDDLGPDNAWNLSYPIGGNYWSDYTGSDLYNGQAQDILGPDGFGDTPYSIDSNSSDSYPLYFDSVPNIPPSAFFSISPASGDVTTEFSLDARGSVDAEDGANLLYRWSWDGGGNWTDWSVNKTTLHQFSEPGVQTVLLEVKDSQGATNISEMSIVTSEIIAEFGSLLMPLSCMVFIVIVAAILRGMKSDRHSRPR